MVKLLRILATIIAIILFIYALLRVIGAVPLFGHVAGWWTLEGEIGAQMVEGVDKVRAFLADSPGVVTLSLPAYFATSALMGVALLLGSIAWLIKRRVAGLWGVGAYVLIWAAMFANYGVGEANSKTLSLAASAIAWVVLLLAWRAEQRGH
ncbi:hypothetical protein [Sphingomicrobium flavum]|uniref:hypothetical protein n=1 Tax=Sphingomicrobium flavum TaxID=1229164 RepID=UPI0021AD8605|nr:hypothetical protein [Sphingomicrobium flavum]